MCKISINKIWVELAIIIVAVAYLRWPLWTDHCLYMYMGSLWRDGYLPYKDIFDQNWPGIIWISQIISIVFGDTPAGIRIFDILWQFATCIVLYKLTQREIGQQSKYLPIFLYLALYFAASYGGTAQREGFASLFLGLSLLLLYQNLAWAIVAGILIGLAALIKPTLLTIPLLLTLYSFISIRTRSYGLIKKVFLANMGIVIVLVATFILFFSLQIIPDFIDAGFLYAFKYSNTDPLWLAKRILQFIIIYPPGRLLLVLLGLLYFFRNNLHNAFKNYGMLLIFTLGALLSLFMQKRLAYYHAMPFCFFGSLLFFKIIHANGNKKINFFGKNVPLMVILLFLIFPIGYDLPKSIFSTITLETSDNYGNKRRVERDLVTWQAAKDIRSYIGGNISRDVKVLVISGTDSPDFYWAANLPPLQKYVQPMHFIFDQGRVKESLQQIKQSSSPTLVIVNSAYKNLIPELFIPENSMKNEIFAGRKYDKLFSKTYDSHSIEIYCVSYNSNKSCSRGDQS
jgi:hypothetical protein